MKKIKTIKEEEVCSRKKKGERKQNEEVGEQKWNIQIIACMRLKIEHFKLSCSILRLLHFDNEKKKNEIEKRNEEEYLYLPRIKCLCFNMEIKVESRLQALG